MPHLLLQGLTIGQVVQTKESRQTSRTSLSAGGGHLGRSFVPSPRPRRRHAGAVPSTRERERSVAATRWSIAAFSPLPAQGLDTRRRLCEHSERPGAAAGRSTPLLGRVAGDARLIDRSLAGVDSGGKVSCDPYAIADRRGRRDRVVHAGSQGVQVAAQPVERSVMVRGDRSIVMAVLGNLIQTL